ncbi:MAG TPA: glycosyltransferase family 4 protein [Syntrophomonadaceae bacterium]|nr:glycosyltransferase family 4 protein [Syntrophomonadaceae bacterium]
MNILNLGTYPPQQCGIASFSKDLGDNLRSLGERFSVAAVSDPQSQYNYPNEVTYQLQQSTKADYASTAASVNKNIGINLVIIQHEYGIYGGADGEYLLDFTTRLVKPFVLITHTVLPSPTTNQKRVLSRLCQQAAAVVCMTKNSASLMTSIYKAVPEKVYVIHHGVPMFQAKNRHKLKLTHGFEGKQLITTFGLIGPGKGIEIGIRTVKELIKRHENLMYLIVGRTHPMLVRQEGERYREMLTDLVTDLGLQDNVRFINRFLEPEELGDYLYMTDIYLSPYPQVDQAISGTLAYALGCGRAIVSTPYIYAQEMLGQGQRGLVSIDVTSQSLAQKVERLLDEPKLKWMLQNRAAKLGERIKWPFIAQQYVNLAKRVLNTRAAAV